MARNAIPRSQRYKRVDTLYLSPERCGEETIRLLNRYARLAKRPVRDVLRDVLLEALPGRIAALK